MNKVYEFKDIPFSTELSEDSMFAIIGYLSASIFEGRSVSLTDLLNFVHSSVLDFPLKENVDEVPF